jgi:ABC-2 type transport system ATP-binding protein
MRDTQTSNSPSTEISYIVEAENLSVAYKLNEFKSSTLKEWIFNRLRGRGKTHEFRAVDNVSFKMRRGESVALVGHNGSGKSTLLRALAGIIPPSPGGAARVTGRIAPLIELGAGFDGELSGRENIFISCLLMGLSLEEIEERLEAIIDFSELREFIHVPVKNYSSGMYARLGFACATSVDPDLLIVDEVLAVGDTNFATKCQRRIEELRERGVSVLMVSHDESAVRRFCDRAVVMNRGVVVFDGNVDQAYIAQNKIMLERFSAAMTPEERRRHEKQIELLERSDWHAANTDPMPLLTGSISLLGADGISSVPDLSKNFSIRVQIQIRQPQNFKGDTYFGMELRHTSGCRIGGVGSEPKVLIREEDIRLQSKLEVCFEFKNGIRDLCGGRYGVVFAVNDMAMNRNVFVHDFGEFEFSNSTRGNNEHSDVISFAEYSPGVSLIGFKQ